MIFERAHVGNATELALATPRNRKAARSTSLIDFGPGRPTWRWTRYLFCIFRQTEIMMMMKMMIKWWLGINTVPKGALLINKINKIIKYI